MKNGNLPANPTAIDINEYKGTINCPHNKPLLGLTKREAFAMAAMQGILSGINSNTPEGEWHGWGEYDFAIHAVRQADALLKQLGEMSNGS